MDPVDAELKGLKENENIIKVWDTLTLTPEERLDELAELYVDYAQKNGFLLHLICAVIKREVDTTKNQMVLFREDCFAIKCINRILFGDLGKKYLVKLVTPLVKTTISYANLIEVTSDLYKNNQKQFDKNIDAMIDILSNFLQIFSKSQQFCPILFREIFAKIQQFVNEKFGKDNNSPLVLDFIFFKFICPAIIHPKKYGLVQENEEVSVTSLRSLINVSKVLNNLAHNIDEKWEAQEFHKLKTFINKNHSILIEKLNQLVDPVDIEKTKMIVSSNVSEILVTPEEKQESEKNLKFLLTSIYNTPNSEGTSEDQNVGILPFDSPLLIKQKITETVDRINDPLWKKEKELKGVTIHSIGNSDIKKYKYQMTIKANAKKIFDYTRCLDNTSIFSPEEVFLGTERFFETDFYHEYRVGVKFGFPLSNREMLIAQWDVVDENRYFVIMDSMPANKAKEIPQRKGTIRGVSRAAWLLEKNGENKTEATLITEVDPRGSIPTWCVNYLSSYAHQYTTKLRTVLEKV